MQTFFRTLAAGPRITWRRRHAAISRSRRARLAPLARRLQPDSEHGFLLIEVIISAMLVAVIVVGTLTGFDVVNRATTSQRQHNQAAGLAAQSQEQLRTDPATALQALGETPHAYTAKVEQTIYTISQKAQLLPTGKYSAQCGVTEKERQSSNAFKITSEVTWAQQKAANRTPVIASSIVTPPTGSGLEIDAGNSPSPTAGVAGITAIVKYVAAGSGTTTTLERTTGEEGCIIFGGLPTTSAIVEIKELVGFVTRAGSNTYPVKEVLIAPNITTHNQVTYNRGGAIEGHFTYNKGEEYEHPNNEGTGTVKEKVASDTFVAYNSLMEVAGRNYEVASTSAKLGAGNIYEPLPGTYEAKTTTPLEVTKYPKGNLFPFLESEKGAWAAYPGDCPENSPQNFKLLPASGIVNPALTTSLNLELSHDTLSLYKGTRTEVEALGASKWKNLETGTLYPVTITNTKCAGAAPSNEAPIVNKHTQNTSTGATAGGHLSDPFQPLGEFSLCVFAKSTAKTYAVKYTNSTYEGNTFGVYLAQKSIQEREAQKASEETKENETAEKRKAKEAETATKAEEAEAAARKKAEETEKAEVKKWEEESKKTGKPTKTEYKTKHTEKETARKAKEAETLTKRTGEETKVREAAEKEEAKVKSARLKREEEETAEATASGVTVESGQAGCP